MKRLLSTKVMSMFLVLLTITSVLISCGDDNPKEENSGKATGDDSSTAETTGPAIDFSGIDYGGYTFTILRYDVETAVGWNGIPNDILITPDQATDILSSAVYERNMKVCSELNINIEMEMDSNAGKLQTEKLALDILAGDHKYDLLVTRLNQYPSFVNRGETLEVNESLDLDTSYSWWDQNFIDSMTVKGKLFALISDMTYMDKLSTNAVFVNATLARDLQIDNLIKKVDDNTWTLDEMLRLAKTAEGIREGVYGLASQNDFSYYVLHSAGIKAISNNNGELSFNLNNERAISVLQKAYSIMNESYFKNRQGTTPITEVADFIKAFAAENDSLFMVRSVQAFYDILQHTTDYIVLPVPKYDANMEHYSASVNGYSGLLYAVPITVDDTERTVNILQAMGMYSEQIVMPELYERVLGLKFAGSEENARMLDIIFSNRIYDFALYNNDLGAKDLILKTNSSGLDTAAATIASSIASLKPSIETAIQNFYSKVENFTIIQ